LVFTAAGFCINEALRAESLAAPVRSFHCDGGGQHEKQLGQGSVKNSKLIFKLRNTQSPEHALEHHGDECRDAKPPHPGARLFQPQPDRQHRREQAHARSHQPVGVFVKDSSAADPFGERKKKHVVPKTGRPIRH
jgi:hypothetical protein